MTDNEKLIEEAATAIEHTPWRLGTPPRMHSVDRTRAALAVFEKAHTPTDDDDILDVIADRLGEHSQARNHEIADSGEYETFLNGPVNVEALAEWLVPTMLRLRRSEAPEPSGPWDSATACFGHCDKEGWYSECVSKRADAEVAEPPGEPSDPPQRLVHEVNMLLSSVASHGPAALTDTSDRMYTAGLLRRLRDALDPKPAQRLAAGNAVRAEMARNNRDVHRMVYGREIANVLAGVALDAALRAAGGVK